MCKTLRQPDLAPVNYQFEDVQHSLVSDFLLEPRFQDIMVNTLEKVSYIHLENIFAVLFVSLNPPLDVLFPLMSTPVRYAPARELIHPFHENVITRRDDNVVNHLLIIVSRFLNHSHFSTRSLVDADFPVS